VERNTNRREREDEREDRVERTNPLYVASRQKVKNFFFRAKMKQYINELYENYVVNQDARASATFFVSIIAIIIIVIVIISMYR